MLAVYESIDLGLIAMLSGISPRQDEPPALDLLRGNHPVLCRDPINDETIYIYNAFGVHAIQLGAFLHKLALALRDDISNDGLQLCRICNEGMTSLQRETRHSLVQLPSTLTYRISVPISATKSRYLRTVHQRSLQLRHANRP